MSNADNKNALTALNTLLSDERCYKLFASLYKALYMPRRAIHHKTTYRIQDLSEIEAETKAYIKDLLGLSEIAPDYSDDILEKIASEIGINTKAISREAHNVAKMLFMTQMENFIEQNLSFKDERTLANKNIRKSILREE